ncbi:MAG: hypothetical protein ACRDI2_09150, partial [Chloroflexota bacterium]
MTTSEQRSIRRRRLLTVAGGAGLALAACAAPAADQSLLREAPIPIRPAATPTPASYPPVRFPQDEAPHDVLAEWWYYTGHLYEVASSQGQEARGGKLGTRNSELGTGGEATFGAEEYGFELVFFRGIRGDRPPG